MTSVNPDVSIVMVTHESVRDLPASLPAALSQKGVAAEVVVVDNASSDGSADLARRLGARVIEPAANLGFAGGANTGIEETSGRFVLMLNPDCRLAPDFCATLVKELDRPEEQDAGSASGKIFRARGEDLLADPEVDSTGIEFRSSGRHFDRRRGEEREIAGVTGAAGFFRRAALESVRISTGYFDSDFFLYREDADLALRLRRARWRCIFVPGAVAYHRRKNLPERRGAMSASVNYHSVKNRFLLRINNSPVEEFRLVPTLVRDFVVVGACLTVERSSLKAFSYLWKNRRRLRGKRREIRKLAGRG
jgi:GT2 family glycosyltransferase